MKSVAQYIPDVDHLLGLTAEELGLALLALIKETPTDPIHNTGRYSLIQFTEMAADYPALPRVRLMEVERAIREAWAWMEAQGLLVPSDGLNGQNGYRELSRRARDSEVKMGSRNPELQRLPQPKEVPSMPTNKVFVVHGHDDGARESVARFLQSAGFEPIILHERANAGRTVIEKVERYGRDVSFAVVLLTPDDEGRAKGVADLESRARQNVLLELGYFMGRLGRERVCVLRKSDVSIPSDFAGAVWVNLDAAGAWKASLVKELKEAGHQVNLAALVGVS